MVARAATAVTGLPPNVEIVMPLKASATSGVAMVKPTGVPLAMPLALVMMSGSTSQCSIPNHFLPVRPKPVCTSSEMNRPPYFLTMLNTILKYSLGGVMKPPAPWIGSARKAAIEPEVAVRITSSTSFAHATPQPG